MPPTSSFARLRDALHLGDDLGRRRRAFHAQAGLRRVDRARAADELHAVVVWQASAGQRSNEPDRRDTR